MLSFLQPIISANNELPVPLKLKGKSKTTLQKLLPKPDIHQNEPSSRRTFRRGAEGLRTSSKVDGITFVEGLFGFYGGCMPIARMSKNLNMNCPESW